MADSVLMPTDAETLRCHMERQRGKLIDIIDSEFGLLNICLVKRVLSNSEIGRIKDKTSRYEKKEQLLLFIANNEKEEDFLIALKGSSQTHVANWIIADGNYRDEFGLDWPLTDTENEALDRNQRTLVEILDTCDLLNRLYSKEVINRWHREFIDSKPTNHDKNEALLEIVRRLSRKGYSIFINCLRDSNQGHVADILENGGAIVPVHATLQGDNLDEAETQIVNEMTDFLCQRATSMEQANRLIAGLQLNIIAVKRGESIVLYIGCCTEEDLNHLRKIVDDRKMKEILEILFNLFIHKLGFRVIILLVNIFENDLAKAKETFKTIDVTDNLQFRYCVDCGRRLKRTDESKLMKCICGCEFCFVCLKKTEQVGSVKMLRCQLDDTCPLAPRQTKKLFNEPEGAKGWFGSASSQSSDPESTASLISRCEQQRRRLEEIRLKTRRSHEREIIEDEEDDSDEFWKRYAMDVTDVQQFRYCVDCGRRLKRTDESKHVKCICGCEFCFVCLKKTEQVGSGKVLRCQLDDTCSAAPRQTEKSFNEPKGVKLFRIRPASSQSSKLMTELSKLTHYEPCRANTI